MVFQFVLCFSRIFGTESEHKRSNDTQTYSPRETERERERATDSFFLHPYTANQCKRDFDKLFAYLQAVDKIEMKMFANDMQTAILFGTTFNK